MTEVEQQPQINGIETIEEDESNKARPADIEAVNDSFFLSKKKSTFIFNLFLIFFSFKNIGHARDGST